jgi:ABC-type multidrug transport system ATPase subunit
VTIRATGLTIRYRRGWRRRPFDALTAIDLEVRDGDFLALIGQNGAGKSTMMHAILGLVPPTAGTVEVFGRSPSPGASMFRQIGYLLEEPRYHEYLSVLEAATYYARLSGIRAPQSRVMELLDQLGLAEHRMTLIRRCSKGMKQKVGIVQCLIRRPRLLLLDEPMRGLDPLTVHLFRDMLLEMNRQGTTIVMNSHLLGEATSPQLTPSRDGGGLRPVV